MKNTIKLLGIIVIAAVIGFSFTACGDQGGNSNSVSPTGLVLSSDGRIRVLFDVGIHDTRVYNAVAAGDFNVTVDGHAVSASNGGASQDASYGNNLRFAVSGFTFTRGVKYTVKVEYTANSAPRIRYSDRSGNSVDLDNFTIEEEVEAR